MKLKPIEMKKLFLFLIIIFNICNAYSQEFYQKYDHENIVINGIFLENKFKKKYLLIGDFNQVEENSDIKLAKVFTNSGWGFIDENGNEIISTIYEEISNFKNGIVLAKLKTPNPSFKGSYDIKTVIINYLGQNLTEKYHTIYDFYNNQYYFQKDFIILLKNEKKGVINNKGEVLLPFNYEEISYTENYLLGYRKSLKGDNFREVDIYNKSGKFLKSLMNYGINEIGGELVTMINNDGSFFLNKTTFERLDSMVFNTLNNVKKSNISKIRATFRDRKNDIYSSYYLDKNLKIISPNFPNSFLVNDKFLVQPIDMPYPKKFIIANLENKKIAEYNYNDFILYLYFAMGRLDDPKYLKKQKKYWKNLETDYNDDFNRAYWSRNIDFHQSNESKDHFPRFYEKDEKGNRKRMGIIDANKGKVIYIKSIDSITYIEKFKDMDYIQATYKGQKSIILNLEGKIIKKINGYLYQESNNFMVSHLKKDTIVCDKKLSGIYIPYNSKTFEPLFHKSTIMKTYYNSYYKEYLKYSIIENGCKKYGIIDNNYNIIRPVEYFSISQNSQKPYTILKKSINEVEILDNNTFESLMEVKFEDSILKKPDERIKNSFSHYPDSYYEGSYNNGFYIFNEDRMVMDRYGNIIDKPENFNINLQ